MEEHLHELRIFAEFLRLVYLGQHFLVVDVVHEVVLDYPVQGLPVVGVALAFPVFVHAQQIHGVLLQNDLENPVS